MVYHCPSVGLSVRPFHMSCPNLRTPWPIHFKFHRVIRIDSLTFCILFGEILIFHSRVMGLYSSNCRRFFLCHAVNGEPFLSFLSPFFLFFSFLFFPSFSPPFFFPFSPYFLYLPIHVYGAAVGEI